MRRLILGVLLTGVFCSATFNVATGQSVSCIGGDGTALTIGKQEHLGTEALENLKVICTESLRITDPEKVTSAIKWLGQNRIKQAIPGLISDLNFRPLRDWEKPNADGEIKAIDGWIDRDDDYPSVEALFQIGKSALPPLVKFIGEKDSESIEVRNATRAVQLIFRESLADAVRFLRKEAENAETDDVRLRLLKAVDRTEVERRKIDEAHTKEKLKPN